MFKLGCSATQMAKTITEFWRQRSDNECTMQCWFQKFCQCILDKEGHEHLSVIDDNELKAW